MKQVIKRIDKVSLQVKNILQIYSQATENELISGRNWYKEAHQLAEAMAVKYNLTIVQTAGIISALSPGTSWSQNVIDANHLCTLLNEGKNISSIVVTTYGNNREKAYKIFCCPEYTEHQVFKLLLGASKQVNKTSSFFLNILHPHIADIVTIDRHSIRVNLGVSEKLEIALTENRYRKLSSAYKQASLKLECNAIELQAITWLVFRRLFVTVRKAEFEEAPF
jgi:hypothetical protein